MRKKIAIPRPPTQDMALGMFFDATKSNIDRITGQEKNKEILTELTETATLEEMRIAVNIIIRRLGSD